MYTPPTTYSREESSCFEIADLMVDAYCARRDGHRDLATELDERVRLHVVAHTRTYQAQPKLPQYAIAARFQDLNAQWQRETTWLSSTVEIVQHHCYQKIIALGPGVVPVILEHMQTHTDHWFEALHVLTGEDPAAIEDWGCMRKMCDTWVDWGRARGLIQ